MRMGLGLAAATMLLGAAVPAQADESEFQMWGSSGRWRILSAPGLCTAGIPDKENNVVLMLSDLASTGRFISVSKAVAAQPKAVTIVLIQPDGTEQRVPTE